MGVKINIHYWAIGAFCRPISLERDNHGIIDSLTKIGTCIFFIVEGLVEDVLAKKYI